MHKIKEFYRKNRLLIIAGLAFILLMQICSKGGRVKQKNAEHDSQVTTEAPSNNDSELKPLNEIYYEEQQNNPERNPEMTSLFILMGLVLLVYVATKRGWLQKLTPSIVWVRISVKRNKATKQRMATISIANHTKESITFFAPVLAFSASFGKARRFRLKGGSDQQLFPLTLMPGTAHTVTLNIDNFHKKAGLSNSFKWVKVEVNAGLKNYQSFWKYLF
ncbi:7TM-DISM domain-containing protein [Carboxylicivirga sp. M1479]|uniref:7TM-DISM domain-containing protein n=1 Tax=Carboxylicivirga sp. M1479 TaxID=2594476 RepID=UPI00117808CE|nr:7TM-DISM domain-containing protein [Carboxylicivirga sp. M1479]TRX66217.1 hypothetical protein FNN09_14375 [Carboxylicivirga sp. M1479]